MTKLQLAIQQLSFFGPLCICCCAPTQIIAAAQWPYVSMPWQSPEGPQWTVYKRRSVFTTVNRSFHMQNSPCQAHHHKTGLFVGELWRNPSKTPLEVGQHELERLRPLLFRVELDSDNSTTLINTMQINAGSVQLGGGRRANWMSVALKKTKPSLALIENKVSYFMIAPSTIHTITSICHMNNSDT